MNNEETIASLKPLPLSVMTAEVACCCPFDEDRRYYRAEIVSVNQQEKKATVCFVDYGNCATVMVSCIKKLPPHLAINPYFAIQCCLEGIKPIKPLKPDPKLGNIAWNKQACQKFSQFTQDIDLEAHVVSEISQEIFSVHLYNIKGENIGKLLCDSRCAEISLPSVPVPSEMVNTSEHSGYKYLDLETRSYKNLFISHAESPAIVWCQPATESSKFEALMADLAIEAPNFPSLSPLEVDAPCCVFYALDESWCRCCVQGIDHSTLSAQVLFVDFGNVETVKLTEIRTIPRKFCALPAQAVSFSLAGISPRGAKDWSKEAIETFKGLVVERNIDCKVVGLDSDGYPAVKMYDPLNKNEIALELIQRGYAKSPLTSNVDLSKPSQPNPKHGSNVSSPRQSQKGDPYLSPRGGSHQSHKPSPTHSYSANHSTRRTGSSLTSPSRSPSSGSRQNFGSSSHGLKYLTEKLQAGQSVSATVSHVESLSEFYILLSSSGPSLKQLTVKVDSYCNSPKARPIESPQPGQPVLARYSGDNGWYRAVVATPPSKNFCVVIFVDFGNYNKVAVSQMAQIPPEFFKLPMQAVACSLNGVTTKRKLPENSIDAFDHIVFEQNFTVSVKRNIKVDGRDVYVVDLVSAKGKSVLKQLIENGVVQESFLESSLSEILSPPVQTRVEVPLPQLPVNQSVAVVISNVETLSNFCVQISDSYLDLKRLSNDLKEHYSKLSVSQEVLSKVEIGEFCAAQFSEDELWYRARITGTSGRQATVTYIDFGNSENVDLSALKCLKPELSKVPCIGISCSLLGVSDANKDSELALDKFFRFTQQQLVGRFTCPLSGYDDVIPIQLTDTSMPNVDVDVYNSIFSSNTASNESIPIPIFIPLVTPVLYCPMEATISYIASPDEFYCQLTSEKNIFDRLMDKMYSYYEVGKSGSSLHSTTVGSYCAAPYSDGSWYRGEITAISPKSVTVFYLDYGNSEVVDSGTICELEPDFCSLPIQGMKCCFSNIEPAGNDQCISKIQDILLDKTVKAIFHEVDESSVYKVQLIVDDEDIADVLHRAGLARKISGNLPEKGSPSVSQDNFVINPYPTTEGSEFRVMVTFVKSPLEFYAQILDEDEKLDSLMQEIASYCASTTPRNYSNWKSGDFVVAQFTEDDTWYRGMITNTSKGGSFEVFYLDYGNSEVLDKSQIQRLTPQSCDLPAQAVKCRLEGAQYYKYNEESTRKFNDLLLNHSFDMKCLSVCDDKTCAVNLQRIDDKVDVMSLAISTEIVQAKISTTSSGKSSNLSIQMFPSGMTIDSYHDVVVVYAESPSTFFCHFSLRNDVLENLRVEMQELYMSDGAKDIKSCNIGDFVAAQFSEDELWYRAVISDVQVGSVQVMFVDYGNSETVVSSRLKTLAPQFLDLPAQAVPCSLAEVVPLDGSEWSKEATDAFSVLTLNHSCVAQIKTSQDMSEKLFKLGDDQRLSISLIDTEVSKSAAEKLVHLGLACFSAASSNNLSLNGTLPEHHPQSVPVQPFSRPYIVPTLRAGDKHEVYISFIESPSCFWLQFSSNEDTLSSIQENLEMLYFDNPDKFCPLVDPLPGATCCAKFSQDGRWYRGIVKSKHPNGLYILFVDYGNSEVVSVSDVRAIKPELQAWEMQAICCCLHSCHPVQGSKEWDESAIGIFGELVNDKPLCAHVISDFQDGACHVKLMDGDSDVCDQLIQCGVAERDMVLADNKVSGPYISPVKLSVGQNLSVYIAFIDSPSNFYCQLSSEYDKLESLMAEIADFYNENNLAPLLEEGAYCVAQYSSNFAWYRAQIVSIRQEGILVNFIDYGNSEEVIADNILALGSHFATLPSQAISCSMVEDEGYPFSPAVLDKFIEYDLNQNFSITVTSVTADGRCVVQLFDEDGNSVNDSLLNSQVMNQSAKQVAIPPPIVDTTPAIKSYQPLQYNIGNVVDVYICHIESPTIFFCQPLELAAELDDMMTEIGSYMASESSQQLPQENFCSGMVCLGQYTENDEWYRAIIEEVISGSNALVNFIDYGNKEVMSSDRIAVLPPQFAKLPIQAFQCSVLNSDGVDMTWNIDQVEHFRSLVPETEQFTVQIVNFVKNKSLHCVVISRNEEPIDMTAILEQQKADLSMANVGNFYSEANRLLLSSHLENSNISMVALKGSKTPSQESGSENGETESDGGSGGKPLIKGPFKLSLAILEVLEVTVVFVESPSLLYVQRADCKLELDALSEEIAQYCTSFEEGQHFPLTFCEGDFVLAKFSEDGLWYRGEVIGVDSTSSDHTAKVTFIDYGNVEVISSDSLVMCPRNFLELPAQSIPCCLAQVPHMDSWPIMYKDLITEFTAEKVMRASVVLPGSQGMKATVKLEDMETGSDLSQAVLDKLQEECEGGANEVIEEEDEEEEEDEGEEKQGAVEDKVLIVADEFVSTEGHEDVMANVKDVNEVLKLQTVLLPQREKGFFSPGSTHQVFVVSCSSPHLFMCQLSNEIHMLDQITAKLSEIYNRTDSSPPSSSSIVEGSYCAVQFSEGMQWYRAKITSCTDELMYSIVCVDFGNTEVVPLQNIRLLDNTLTDIPPLAVECFLSGVEVPSGKLQFPPTAAEKMLELLCEKEYTMEVVTVDSGGRCGVVITSLEGLNIGIALTEANLASPLPLSIDSTPPILCSSVADSNLSDHAKETGPCDEEEAILRADSILGVARSSNHVISDISEPLTKTIELYSDPALESSFSLKSDPDKTPSEISTSNGPASHSVVIPSASLNSNHSIDTNVPTLSHNADDLTSVSHDADNLTTVSHNTDDLTTVSLNADDPPASSFSAYPSTTSVITDLSNTSLTISPSTTLPGTAPSTDSPGTVSSTAPFRINPSTSTDLPTTEHVCPHGDSTAFLITESPVTIRDNSPSSESATTSQHSASEYLKNNLPIGSRYSVKVTAVSSLEEFSCQLSNNQDQLDDLMNAIAARNYQVDSLSCTQPELSLPVCACSSSNIWQRGKIVSSGLKPNTFKVLYVDYGTTEVLPLVRIKCLEKRFIEALPPQAICCSLPVLRENDINTSLPSSLDVWELDWPVSCIEHFSKLSGGIEGDSIKLSMEILEAFEDDTYIVKLCNSQLDIRDALLTKLRDPDGCVVKGDDLEAVCLADTMDGLEDLRAMEKESPPVQGNLYKMEENDEPVITSVRAPIMDTVPVGDGVDDKGCSGAETEEPVVEVS